MSHPGRVLFPGGLTKLDLARHYATVAPAMLPHVRGRPLTMRSYPQGIASDGYFAKDAPRHFPGWIATVPVPRREGGTIRHVVADEGATLVYVAGQNAVELHVWSSRADRLERPDRLVFDLDPAQQPFAEIRAAARALGDLVRDLGLDPFAMTTGSRGLHVVVPLRRTEDFGVVHAFGRDVAQAFAATDPDRLTTETRIARRDGRLFVDVGRTAYGQHAIAPYSARAIDTAPVATPLHWEELGHRGLRPRGWTIATIGARLADGGDPWRHIGHHARVLGPARRALARR